MAETSVTLTFITEAEKAGETLIMQLDDDAIKSFYGLAEGETKGSWLFGDSVFIAVFKYPATVQYEIVSSAGTLTPDGNGIKSITKEWITFGKKSEGNLSLPKTGDLSHSFYCTFDGTVSAEGQSITLSQPALGVLECDYSAAFDRYKLTLGEMSGYSEFPVIVYAATVENEEE